MPYLIIILSLILVFVLYIVYKEKQNTKFYKLLIHEGDSITLVSDENNNITYISKNVERILGFKREELLGSAWWNLTTDEITEKEFPIQEIKEKLKEEKTTIRLVKTKWNDYKWIQWKDKNVKGNLTIGIGQDVTYKIEEELKIQEQNKLELKRQNALNEISKIHFDENVSLNQCIQFILKKAAENITGDVLSLLEYNKKRLKIISLYIKESNVFDEGDVLMEYDYPGYFSKIKTGEIIQVYDVFNNDDVKEFQTGYFEKNQIKSLLDIPIFINGELKYVISCETTHQQHNWNENDISYLKSVTENVLLLFENEKRRKIENLIKENENNFRLINETIEDVFWLYDLTSDEFLYISPSCYDVLGRTQNEFVVTRNLWREYVIQEDIPIIENAHKFLRETGSFEIEYRIINGDTIRWIKEKAKGIFENGRLIKNAGVCIDITDDKKREEELKKLSIISEKTTDAIALTDAEGNISWVNKAYENLFEIEKEKVFGKKSRDLFVVENEMKSHLEEINGQNFRIELEVKTAKNEFIWIQVSNTVVFDDNLEKVIYQIDIITDITEEVNARKRIENQNIILENYTKELEFQNQLKESLLGVESFEEIYNRTFSLFFDKLKNVKRVSLMFPDFYGNSMTGFALNDGEVIKEQFFTNQLACFESAKKGNVFFEEDLEHKLQKSASDEVVLEGGVRSYMICPLHFNNEFLGLLSIGFSTKLDLSFKEITSIKDAAQVIAVMVNQINLKNLVLAKTDDMLASIRYAKNIQQAMFSNIKTFSKNFNEVALFFKPKDIVSGDFYWTKDNERYSVLALGDCTGHGVPGAFLTLLGINLLEQITEVEQIFSPSQILELIDERLTHILSRNKNHKINNDGMELGILVYDKEKQEIVFSGAGLGILYFKNDEEHHIRGAKRTIGEEQSLAFNFHNHSLKIKGDEVFYMATDGYQDQLGGEKYKRFSKERLIALLNEIKEFSSVEKETRIEEEIIKYRGEVEQLDDFTVLSFKIKV